MRDGKSRDAFSHERFAAEPGRGSPVGAAGAASRHCAGTGSCAAPPDLQVAPQPCLSSGKELQGQLLAIFFWQKRSLLPDILPHSQKGSPGYFYLYPPLLFPLFSSFREDVTKL